MSLAAGVAGSASGVHLTIAHHCGFYACVRRLIPCPANSRALSSLQKPGNDQETCSFPCSQFPSTTFHALLTDLVARTCCESARCSMPYKVEQCDSSQKT